MILMAVVAGPVGWEANRVTRMRRAVAVLERPVAGEQREPGSALFPPLTAAELAPQSRVTVFHDLVWRDHQLHPEPRFAWLPDWCRHAIGEDHFRVVSGLTFDRRPTPEDWAAVAALASPVHIGFDQNSIADDDLRGLGSCRNVEQLDLSNTQVTDAALAEIGRLPHLTALDLDRTKVTDAALPTIGRMSTLRDLGLDGTAVTDKGLAPLAGLADLETLRCGAAGTDAGLARLRGLGHLRILGLANFDPGVSDAGLTRLGEFRNLEEVSVSVYGITEVGLKALVGLPKLRKLDLSPAIRENLALDLLMLALKRDIDYGQTIRLSPTGLEELAKLQHLESLNLATADIDDAWLRAIGQLARLRELSIAGSRITDGGLKPLAQLGQLRNLHLEGSRITDAGLEVVGNLVRLDVLYLDCPKVSDAGLVHLRPLTSLSILWLTDRITAEGIAQLQTSVPNLRNILTLRSISALKSQGPP